MVLPIENSWLFFAIIFGFMLLVTFVMSRLSLNFFTKDVVIRKFSIMDLEVPATPLELKNLIDGLYELPQEQSGRSVKSLKSHLYLDFLFMPFAYGSIILLCLRISNKMELGLGQFVFVALAVLQLLSWLADIIENIYLLRKIRPKTSLSSKTAHKIYLGMQAVKWGIALTATVFSMSAVCYFWLAGLYTPNSLTYLLIVLAEIIIFLVAQYFLLKEKQLEPNL